MSFRPSNKDEKVLVTKFEKNNFNTAVMLVETTDTRIRSIVFITSLLDCSSPVTVPQLAVFVAGTAVAFNSQKYNSILKYISFHNLDSLQK